MYDKGQYMSKKIRDTHKDQPYVNLVYKQLIRRYMFCPNVMRTDCHHVVLLVLVSCL